MRRKVRQKASTAPHQTWNRMWQIFCPWVGGVNHAPLDIMPVRRRAKLRALIAAAAIGFTLNAAPVLAGDFSSDGQIVLAALNNTVPRYQDSTPNLFGATEQRHGDIRPFTKWTGVLKRFKREFAASLKEEKVQDWMEFLASLKDASDEEKIAAVNDYMNAIPFSSDEKNYGMRDHWATPMEFLARGKGDCEDYVMAKYISLRSLGFSQDRMRLAVVFDHVMQQPHALLIVYQEGESKVLDSQNPEIMNSADISRYKPIYSISQVAWWRH